MSLIIVKQIHTLSYYMAGMAKPWLFKPFEKYIYGKSENDFMWRPFFFREHRNFETRLAKYEIDLRWRPFFLENTMNLGRKIGNLRMISSEELFFISKWVNKFMFLDFRVAALSKFGFMICGSNMI